MTSPRLSDADIAQLAKEWDARLDDALELVSSTPEELRELAEKQRRLAALSDNEGQRRGFIGLAERYEREAEIRAAARR